MVPRLLCLCLCAWALGIRPAGAETRLPLRTDITKANAWYPSLNYQGSTGLIDMPSARGMADGAFVVSASGKQPDQRAAITFQATPWLEGSFKYAHINGFTLDQPNYYDRSFALKLRIVKEGRWWPAVAVGMTDLIGTGIYGGEYVVASKRLGNFDVSLGMGWGRFGQSGAINNPLIKLSERFRSRDNRSLNETGQLDASSYLSGNDMGFFGGVEYSPPIRALRGLKLQLEYSSDRYRREGAAPGVGFKVRSPVNVGVVYEPLEGVEIGAHYLYGTTWGVRFALKADPTKRLEMPSFDAEPDPFRVRPEEARGPDESGQVTPESFRAEKERIAGSAMSSGPVLRFASVETSPPPSPKPQPERRFLPGAGRNVVIAPYPSLGVEREAVLDEITREADRVYLSVSAIEWTGPVIRVYFSNRRYDRASQAFGRMTRVMSQYAPDTVRVFELVLGNGQSEMTMATIARGEFERAWLAGGRGADLRTAVRLEPAPRKPDAAAWHPKGIYPSFDYGFKPGFRQSLFDPDDPFRYQVKLSLYLSTKLARGLSLDAVGSIDIWNNFDEIRRGSDSVLPRVRSEFARYLKEGESGIDGLALNYGFKLRKDVYARVSAGYLEEMFAGAGGEVLYRPYGKRWALGANLYAVRQRSFNKLFGLRDYRTVTGHASLYYQSPFHDLQFNVHAGRYLAKDYGATFEVLRRFDTGVEVGAFATFTNVPFSDFGEGSFDKGIIIRMPLGWFVPFSTRQSYGLDLRPLTRDGGQRLTGATRLYRATTHGDHKELQRNWDGFVE